MTMSHDHKPHLETEVNRINEAGGKIINGRVNGNLNLTRSLGDLVYKRQPLRGPEKQIISCYPEVIEQTLDGTEQLLALACDGIWDVLSNAQLVQKVQKYISFGYSLKDTCERITMDCLSKRPYDEPGWDNMTLIVVKFKSYNVILDNSKTPIL